MTWSAVQFDLDTRGVARLSLDCPTTHNSLDEVILREMLEAFDHCEREAVRVLCLRANGKHFCAGANVRELSRRESGGANSQSTPPLMQVLRRLNTLPIPTIALVHGGCIGGGVGLVACCDVVVAEETAFFSIPEVRLGIPPAALIPYFVAAIGARQLRRYMLSGERFSGKEAWRISLAHQLCPAGHLSETAEPIIDSLLHGGPLALADAKRAALEVAPIALSEEREAALHHLVTDRANSPEALEGRAAFLEKRSPSWHRTVDQP
jgi:methylglutaconyl-CoA hydratase